MMQDINNADGKLLYSKSNVFERRSKEELNKMREYAKGYMKWISKAKTEREAAKEIINMLKNSGFKEYLPGDNIRAGDKLYYNNRGKNIFAVVVGSESLENGIRICASHIDSPRLDLKPNPLFESDGVGYFKTHYYGGIRKYQWATIPLALHGVIAKSDGSIIDVTIGEDEGDPLFCISDLLPHLAKEQDAKTLGQAFSGEGLNIMICSSPYTDSEGKMAGEDKIKLQVMSILNEKYGITESDFISAELCAVPAGKAVDIGLDRWLVGSYGHDDRVCAYSSLTALLDNCNNSKHTLIFTFADKEETGSDGSTGMKSKILGDLIDQISRDLGSNAAVVRSRSACLSADVSAAYDPNYPEVSEKKNAAILHCGVALAKYTGSKGKYDTNDASAEYVAKIRAIFEKSDVIWQMAELGKVDQGGGGTVAKFISRLNIDTIDIGVPVISMHAPFEIISKADLYEAYRAFCAFCVN